MRAFPRDALLLGLALFLMVSAGNVLTPLLPLVQREFGIDYTSAGLLVSSYAVARLALDLPAGFLHNRLGAGRLALVGFVFGVIGSLVAAVGPTLQLVVAGRIAMGLGSSIVSVVILTTLGALAPANARTRVLSVYAMSNNTAISIFPVVGGALGSAFGWRSTMLLCAGLACASAAILTPILARVRAQAPRPSESQAAPVSLGAGPLLALGLLYAGIVLYMLNRHGFRNTALPLFAHDRIGLDSVAIASGITVIAITGVLVAIPGALIADRYGRRRVIAAGFIVLALGDLMFLAANSYATFLFAALMFGLGDFFAGSQTALLTESVPPSWRSRILAGYRFTVDLGATIGPVVLAGLLQVAGFEWMVLIAAGLLLLPAIGTALAAYLARPRPVAAVAPRSPASAD